MNENVKKIVLGVIAAVAVVFAVIMGMNSVSEPKENVVGSLEDYEKQSAAQSQEGGQVVQPDGKDSQ